MHCSRLQFSRRQSSSVVHSSTSLPPVADKTATPVQIVEYNGQKVVAKVATDGSVEEASGEDVEGHATTIVGRAKEAASGTQDILLCKTKRRLFRPVHAHCPKTLYGATGAIHSYPSWSHKRRMWLENYSCFAT